MTTSLEAFKTSLMAQRVASRFATEFPSEEALKDYLHEHPGADKSKHTVKKDDGEEKGKGKPPIENYLKNIKRHSESVGKSSDQMKKLKEQFENATGYKGDKDRAKRIGEKINNCYHDVLLGTDTALNHAQSAVNIARKHGANEDDISRLEAAIDDAQKKVKKVKESKDHDPIKGEWRDGLTVQFKANSMEELAGLVGTLSHATQLLSNG